ncbi:hypothetical protein GYMLUDRAFT_483521 [Collybiopsis luxurians FD-317 M1]|uniref:Uncharacterized protein n=1 Tax=Collybiopsis luxurians FD-317 M1 TaxID=944289 RepID=A0A0D0BGU8_9AGAR|nr:hypothetical protein GYMLUDRAFT_483521 [Collybiopsis luxurians FD-317 M1]
MTSLSLIVEVPAVRFSSAEPFYRCFDLRPLSEMYWSPRLKFLITLRSRFMISHLVSMTEIRKYNAESKTHLLTNRWTVPLFV